jgi:methanogenic corrinoid protein MtbC1
MSHDVVLERFFETLVNGDRPAARTIVQELLDKGVTPDHLLNSLCFPVYEKIEQLFRADQLTNVAYHMSTRLLRMLIDQVASKLTAQRPNGKTVFAVCGPSQSEELAAQIAVDLLEAAGCDVTFCGGGVPGDEVLAQVHERRPDVLLVFAPAASDLPDIREMIDRIREIGAVDRTKIVVAAGVFNRAEGLAEEIHCDLWASSPLETVDVVLTGALSRNAAKPETIGKIGARVRGATTRRAA